MRILNNFKLDKKNFLKILKRILMFFVFFFGVINIMRLYYNDVGWLISKVYNMTHFDNGGFLDNEKLIGNKVGDNFKIIRHKNMFINNCDLGSPDAYGRFLVYLNKICIKDYDDSVLNHEMVHYTLWNQPMYKKLVLREKIVKQIENIKRTLNDLKDIKLTGQDLAYYNYLKDVVNNFASQPEYRFYDILKDFVFSFRGNEEFITYGVGDILIMNKGGMKMRVYKLQNPLLKIIDNGYRSIYSDIIYGISD